MANTNKTAEQIILEVLSQTEDRRLGPLITFHPKLDLLNTNIGEIILAKQIADSAGTAVKWIPYTYDVGFKTRKEKIKNGLGVYFENEFINLISPDKVSNLPLSFVAPFNKKDVEKFVKELKKTFRESLTLYRSQVDEIKFGHPFFALKRQSNLERLRKTVDGRINELYVMLTESVGLGRISDQLIHFNTALLSRFGLTISVETIDSILANNKEIIQLLNKGYEQIVETTGPQLKIIGNGNMRMPLYAIPENFSDLTEQRRITMNGGLFLAIANHLGYRLTISGTRTNEYYPQLMQVAEKISETLGEKYSLKYLSHDMTGLRKKFNIRELASVLRILDKNISKAILNDSNQTVASLVADHIAYLSGSKNVPEEFTSLTLFNGKNVYEKRQEELQQYTKALEALRSDNISQEEILRWFIRLNLQVQEKGYLLRVLEEKVRKTKEYISHVQNNLVLDRTFLGGTLEGIYKDGVVLTNRRYPTLISAFIYNNEPISKQETDYILGEGYCVCRISKKNKELETEILWDNNKILNRLIDKENLSNVFL